MSIPTQRSRHDVAAVTGMLFAVAVIGGVMVATAPRPDEPAAVIQRAFLGNAAAVRIQGFIQTLAAVLLLPFTASLAGLVRRTERRSAGLAEATLGGGVLAAAFLAVQALLTATLGVEQINDSPATASALRQLAFYTGGVGHVVWLGVALGAASLAAHRADVLPRWLTVAGLISATLSILSLASLTGGPAFLALFIPLGRFSALLVIVAASVLMMAGRTDPATTRNFKGGSLVGGVAVVVLAFALTIFV